MSQQDLAAVKADMQREMDQIHTELHYWQNIVIAILKDQHRVNTGGITIIQEELIQIYSIMYIHLHLRTS